MAARPLPHRTRRPTRSLVLHAGEQRKGPKGHKTNRKRTSPQSYIKIVWGRLVCLQGRAAKALHRSRHWLKTIPTISTANRPCAWLKNEKFACIFACIKCWPTFTAAFVIFPSSLVSKRVTKKRTHVMILKQGLPQKEGHCWVLWS